jgi:hypothetical protein
MERVLVAAGDTNVGSLLFDHLHAQRVPVQRLRYRGYPDKGMAR